MSQLDANRLVLVACTVILGLVAVNVYRRRAEAPKFQTTEMGKDVKPMGPAEDSPPAFIPPPVPLEEEPESQESLANTNDVNKPQQPLDTNNQPPEQAKQDSVEVSPAKEEPKNNGSPDGDIRKGETAEATPNAAKFQPYRDCLLKAFPKDSSVNQSRLLFVQLHSIMGR